MFMEIKKNLKIANLSFRNPVLTASGTSGFEEYKDFIDFSKIGSITLKTITYSPRKGNPQPRILEVTGGLLNSIGLENDGFERVYNSLIEKDYLGEYPTNIIFSLAGDGEKDFKEMIEKFSEIKGISMFELNLSCPNVHEGGKTFDSNRKMVEKIVKIAKKCSKKPFTVKLSPSNDFITNSIIAEENGADAVTISNTFYGTKIDIKTRNFYFKNKVAGFSGPAVKPMALWNVYRVCEKVKIPVIASGGISSVEDAIEFMLAGASFLSIGTIGFVEPKMPQIIAEELEKKLKEF
uniref:Dihydroorotate dehydrogenase n=1 Tax=candidate division CPR3 bacterium TaxID=2268181 RepID=A0A7C4M2R8_UNCC3